MKGESTIFTKFLNLKPEKKERILNAAMKEFAQKGFKNASTDVIVKDADISKGALFHYFHNKKDLFVFLYDYAMDLLKNEMLEKLDTNERDVFIRRRQALVLKTEILNKHPELYDFLLTAYLEDAIEVKSEIEHKNQEAIALGHVKLYEGIDTSMFKDDIDISKAIEIISWTVEGYVNKQRAIIKNTSPEGINQDEMLEEFDKYLNILRKSFYK